MCSIFLGPDSKLHPLHLLVSSFCECCCVVSLEVSIFCLFFCKSFLHELNILFVSVTRSLAIVVLNMPTVCFPPIILASLTPNARPFGHHLDALATYRTVLIFTVITLFLQPYHFFNLPFNPPKTTLTYPLIFPSTTIPFSP